MLGSWRQQEQELAAIISAETSPCTLPPPAAWCSHFTVDNSRYNSRYDSRYNSRYDRTLRPGVHAVTTHPRLRPAVGEQTTAVHSSPATAPESAFHIEAPPTAAAPAPQHHSTTATTTRHRAGLFSPGSKLLCSNIGLGGAAEEDLNNVKICSLRLR